MFDSFDPNDQQFSHPQNTNGNDMFMPSSNTGGPGSYYNQYDPDGQQQNSNPFIQQQNAYRPNPSNPQKNIKKQELPPRIKGTSGSNSTSNSYAGQQSSDPSKTPRRPGYQPPSKSNPNHIEKNIDMIKNKENYYNRYPPRKYEDSYVRRKELQGGHDNYDEESGSQSPRNRPRKSSLPLTVNIHTSDSSHNRSLPTTVTIPIGKVFLV